MIQDSGRPLKILMLILLCWILLVNVTHAIILTHKPALDMQPYKLGWQDGCQTGLNSIAPLRSILSEQPFIRKPLKGEYQDGWNEGYTICRFSQDSVEKWMQAFLLVGAAFFFFAKFMFPTKQ